jgi:hypothetical protein
MLAEFATRLIFQFAIRNRTWAGPKVLNSPIDPLSELMDEKTDFTPLIAVYSDDTEIVVKGQELSTAGAKSGLTISIYVPPSAILTLGGHEIELQGRGPLASFAIDVIAYQIRQALLDPNNPWGRLWARFVPKIEKISLSPPFLEGDKGVRIPTRAMLIEYTAMSDPVAGKPITETWRALLDAMMAEPKTKLLGQMLESAIQNPAVAPDWQRVMMLLGLSDETALAAGIRPLEPVAPIDPDLAEVVIYDEDEEPFPP